MALSALDPKTALRIADLQNGIIGSPCIHLIGEVMERARVLTDAFRALGAPVVFINICRSRAGGATCELPRCCRRTRPRARRYRCDEADTGRLRRHRSRNSVERTERHPGGDRRRGDGTGVEATARQADEQRLNVTRALNAMTDVRPDAHGAFLIALFSARQFGRVNGGNAPECS
jgi:hypothetical protein